MEESDTTSKDISRYKEKWLDLSRYKKMKMDIPNTLPSLKLLEQKVHQLVGGGGGGYPFDNVVGSKRLRSGRVKLLGGP